MSLNEQKYGETPQDEDILWHLRGDIRVNT